MRILTLLTLVELYTCLTGAAVLTPDYHGDKPIAVTTGLSARGGAHRLHLKASVHNFMDEAIENVQLCLRVNGLDNNCTFEWNTSRIPSQGYSKSYESDVEVDPVALKKLIVSRSKGEISHTVEILNLTKPPMLTPPPSLVGYATCGAFEGPIGFDAEWNASLPGWTVKPFVAPALGEKFYFDGYSAPLAPVKTFKSRWVFSMQMPGANDKMRLDFHSWKCPANTSTWDVATLARVVASDGKEVPTEWKWVKDDSPSPLASFKLVGKAPPRMALRIGELRVKKVLSLQVMNESWTDFLQPDELNKLQSIGDSGLLPIPIHPQVEKQTARLVALTYFERNKLQEKQRVFCFPLVSGSEINLDEKEKFEDCRDNTREIRFHVTFRGKPYGKELTFATTGPKGDGTELIGPMRSILKGKNLPDAIRLEKDPDFEDGIWDLTEKSDASVTDVEVALEPRERTLIFNFIDENGNPVIEPISNGHAMEADSHDESISPSQPYTAKVHAILHDPIHVTATSQSYSIDQTVIYDGNPTISLSMNHVSPADAASKSPKPAMSAKTDSKPVETTTLKPVETVSISLRPYFKLRAKDQLVNASVKIQYEAINGIKDQSLLKRGTDSYAGTVTKIPGSEISALIELSTGEARVLKTEASYPVDSKRAAKYAIPINFSKPIAAVLVNPSARFQRAKQASWLDDIKAGTWRIFQELNKPQWDDILAYRYFSVVKASQHQLEILKQAETTSLQVNAEDRENLLSNIVFNAIEVAPEDAIQSFNGFLNGFSFPAAATRGFLVYIQAAATAPLESGDAVIDNWDRDLGRAGIRAIIIQLSPGIGDPKELTRANHRNLKLIRVYMETESKTFFAHAFDQVLSDVATFREGLK